VTTKIRTKYFIFSICVFISSFPPPLSRNQQDDSSEKKEKKSKNDEKKKTGTSHVAPAVDLSKPTARVQVRFSGGRYIATLNRDMTVEQLRVFLSFYSITFNCPLPLSTGNSCDK
jgi:hypothetical protein